MRSPSSRRAWIEISAPRAVCLARRVALLAEGVDRNEIDSYLEETKIVALLAEGVDRNDVIVYALLDCPVALLAEGVDRNLTFRVLVL